MDLKCAVFRDIEAKKLICDPLFIQEWDALLDYCSWATVFQSRKFVTTWYTYFEKYPIIILTDWDGAKMTGLLTLTMNKKKLLAAGLDLAEYQSWLSTPENCDNFLEKALNTISFSFPGYTLYLKYLTQETPTSLFFNNPSLKNRAVFKPYVHPIMETCVEILECELKKKNKKEKINRLKKLGNLEFFVAKENEQFRSLIEEMSLQSDFRKGAFYNKTFFHDEPERKSFLLKLFELGLLHVSGLSVDGKLIASNAGIMGPDRVYLQGINSHSPFFSKYSPGILQFLMLGMELGTSGFRYFDLTPGGADGYKSELATETCVAYEFWFTSKSKAIKKKWSEHLKNWIKPWLLYKRFLGEDLSNLNMAGMRLMLKLRFTFKGLKNLRKLEHIHFLERESICIPLQGIFEKYMSLENLTEEYILRENHIPDLFLFDESLSIFPRMDIFTDCIVRLEYGQTMFTLTSGSDLVAICWFIPLTAKTRKIEINQSTRPPILIVSYYKNLKAEEMLGLFMKIENDFLNGPLEKISLEIGKKQNILLTVFKKSNSLFSLM